MMAALVMRKAGRGIGNKDGFMIEVAQIEKVGGFAASLS
jgi:hypothetical protein